MRVFVFIEFKFNQQLTYGEIMSTTLKHKIQVGLMYSGLLFAGVGLPSVANAQEKEEKVAGATAAVTGMVDAICEMIRPMVGSNSKILALVFLIALGVMIFLWWLSENKEGVMVWVLRTGVAIGILINLLVLPQTVGLPSVC